jgi:hypothetical protein
VQDENGKGMQALRGITPNGLFQVLPNGVRMEKALYNVRMLRPGYLYLYIEDLCRKPYWEAYTVHPHGYLNPFYVETPQAAEAKVACKRDARQANNSLVWVDATTVTKVWYLFSPDPLDYQHLKNEIEKSPDKYMQSLDVAGWLKGNQGQNDTCTPSLLDMRVVEYKALKDEALRDALEPQLYGLMGASPKERGWGDYEEEFTQRYYSGRGSRPSGGFVRVRHRVQPSYETAHGPRLEGMRKFLNDHKGMVAACEDPLGIAQELGHLQVEAQTYYTHWQSHQAEGFADKVSNEWAYQSAIGGQGLAELFKQNTLEAAEKYAKRTQEAFNQFDGVIRPQLRDRTEEQKEQWKENLRTQAKNAQGRLEKLKDPNYKGTGNPEFDEHYKLFDQAGAEAIKTKQKNEYEELQKRLDALGKDQVTWLKSDALKEVMGRYSRQDSRIGRSGGGAALSMQLAHCLAGTENCRVGRDYLDGLELEGDNPLARVLNFSNATIEQTHKAIEAAKLPPPDPKAEPDMALTDQALRLIQGVSMNVSLAEEAVSFIDAFKPVGQSGQLRQQGWHSYVTTLLSTKVLKKLPQIKIFQSVLTLSVGRIEATLVRYMAKSAITLLGEKVREQAYVTGLVSEHTRRPGQKIGNLAAKAQSIPEKKLNGTVKSSASSIRGKGFGVFGGVCTASLAAYQASVNPTVRGVSQAFSGGLQIAADIAGIRATVYEKTIYDTIRVKNLLKEPALKPVLSNISSMELRALRMTAFRFAAPAAVISIYWDLMDALKSWDRGSTGLAIAQAAAAVGTLFTVGGILAGAVAVGVGVSTTATLFALGSWLGLIGAAVVLIAFIGIWIFQDEAWANWLTDNPLNKTRKGKSPIHDDLAETLQKLASIQAELQGT